MTEISSAVALLRRHNRWRRGDESLEMEHPKAIGEALDLICDFVENGAGEGCHESVLAGEWMDAKKTPPEEDGPYIVHAPSENPDKPFITMAWHLSKSGWSMLPECWCKAITHWMSMPNPPNNEPHE